MLRGKVIEKRNSRDISWSSFDSQYGTKPRWDWGSFGTPGTPWDFARIVGLAAFSLGVIWFTAVGKAAAASGKETSTRSRGGSGARKEENNKSSKGRERVEHIEDMVERIRRAELGKETTPGWEKDGKGTKGEGKRGVEGRSGARRKRSRDGDGKTSPRTSVREKSFAQDSFWETEARNCQSAKEIVEKFCLTRNGKRGADARPSRKRGAPCRLSETLLLSVKRNLECGQELWSLCSLFPCSETHSSVYAQYYNTTGLKLIFYLLLRRCCCFLFLFLFFSPISSVVELRGGIRDCVSRDALRYINIARDIAGGMQFLKTGFVWTPRCINFFFLSLLYIYLFFFSMCFHAIVVR